MITVLLMVIGITMIIVAAHISNVYAVDFFDNTGYIPAWAISMNQYQALERCSSISGDTTKDGEWCLQWTAQVVGSGKSPYPIIGNITQGVKLDRLCTENYICAYSGEFIEYAGVFSHHPSDVGLLQWNFIEPNNKTNIDINEESSNFNPTIDVLDKRTGMDFDSTNNVTSGPIDYIVPLPVEKSIKSNPGYMYSNTTYYYKTEQILGKSRTVFVAHEDNGNGQFIENHYDNETGINVLETDQSYSISADGKTMGRHEAKLVNTNIFDYNTILQPDQQPTPIESRVPEFPFTSIILVLSMVTLVVFYRINPFKI